MTKVAILRRQRTEHAKKVRRMFGDNSGKCRFSDKTWYPARDGLSNAISTVEKDNYLLTEYDKSNDNV